MSRETYVRGFCKAAAARGVDPKKLAKYASFTWVANDQDESKGGLQGNKDAYAVPKDDKGSTGWLGSTNPISIRDGRMEISVPGGAASLTNSPNASIQRVVHSGNSATTNSIPVWRKLRPSFMDALYGVHPYGPSGEMKRLMEYIATNKAPVQTSSSAKK